MCAQHCETVLEFVCVCQKGSLAGGFTVVGIQRGSTVPLERTTEQMFTVKKLCNKTGQDKQLKTHTHTRTQQKNIYTETEMCNDKKSREETITNTQT